MTISMCIYYGKFLFCPSTSWEFNVSGWHAHANDNDTLLIVYATAGRMLAPTSNSKKKLLVSKFLLFLLTNI